MFAVLGILIVSLAYQVRKNLKTRIQQLCERFGIQFVETEESYTSKASFVDSDFLPKYREKPEGWESSGRRVKRGLYRTGNNQYINCDCNGAANIIRKVAVMLGLDLSGISRGELSATSEVQTLDSSRISAALALRVSIIEL